MVKWYYLTLYGIGKWYQWHPQKWYYSRFRGRGWRKEAGVRVIWGESCDGAGRNRLVARRRVAAVLRGVLEREQLKTPL